MIPQETQVAHALLFSLFWNRKIDGVLRDGTGQLPAKCLRLVFVCYLLFDARKIAVRHLWVMRSVPIVFAPLLCFQALTPKTIFWCPDCLDSLFVRYVAGRNMARRVPPPRRTPTLRAGSFHLVRAVSSRPQNAVIPRPPRRTRNLHFLVTLLATMHAHNRLVRILSAARNAHGQGREDGSSRIDTV